MKEFLSTSDSGEVARCIRELDVPHYHHEIGKHHKNWSNLIHRMEIHSFVLVYEGILIALENYQNEMVANSMVWLLQYLYTKEVSRPTTLEHLLLSQHQVRDFVTILKTCFRKMVLSRNRFVKLTKHLPFLYNYHF